MTTNKPILQALLDTEPLTAAEVREIILRHVMSGHADRKNEPITQLLLQTYKAVWQRDHVQADDLLVPGVARLVMKEHFVQAYVEAFGQEHPRVEDFWLWPVAVPMDADLPRELCVFLGMAIGYKVGHDVRKHHDLIQNKVPTN